VERSSRVLRFFERLLTLQKGHWTGRPFVLLPWQRDRVIRPIFDRVDEDGLRIIRTALIGVPRKQGKSPLAAGLGLHLLMNDSEPNAEILAVASDKIQGRVVFEEAKRMLHANPSLAAECDIQKEIIFHLPTNSTYEVVSADAQQKHGLNPHAVIFDELHTQDNRELWDTLTTAQGARRQPLVLAFTTAGFDSASLCYELFEYGKAVEEGRISDRSFHFVWYGAEKDDDPFLEETWKAANPSFDVTVKGSFYEREFQAARFSPARLAALKRLYLNIWTETSDVWLDIKRFQTTTIDPVSFEDFRGHYVAGGLDLSAVSDMTALVWAARINGRTKAIARFWIPEEKLKDPRNGSLYRAWRDLGFLSVTPGATVDYAFVKKQILEDAGRLLVERLNVDRLFQAHQLMTELADERLPVLPMSQGFASMTAPAKELERLVLSGELSTGGNPILSWQAGHTVAATDAAGNIKPDRKKSREKIDGIIALVMALDGVMRLPAPASVKLMTV